MGAGHLFIIGVMALANKPLSTQPPDGGEAARSASTMSGRTPGPLETELAFGWGRTRYGLRYRRALYAPAVRDVFGDTSKSDLLSLTAGEQVVRGRGRSRAWELFKDVVNIESAVPSCSPAGAEVTIRAMDKLAATGLTAGKAEKPSVKTWVLRIFADGDANVGISSAAQTRGFEERVIGRIPSPAETELVFGCNGTLLDPISRAAPCRAIQEVIRRQYGG